MTGFLIRRLLQIIPTIIAITLIVFILLSVMPGDAAFLRRGFVRGSSGPEVEALIRERLGLDRPLHIRYLSFLAGLLQGNLGRSFQTEREVVDILKVRLPVSLRLVFLSLLIAVLGGVTLGFISALKQGSVYDLLCMGGAIIGVSMPYFWLGLLLMYFFGVQMSLLPTSGYGEGSFLHMIMPAVTLSAPYLALLARISRAAILDKMQADYVRTAYAKGLKDSIVRRKHIFRNALIPIMTIIGLNMGSMLANIVVVEQVFSWPGIGHLMVRSIYDRDLPLFQGCVLIIAFTYIGVNLLVDVLYSFVDPRIRYE